MIKWNLKFYCLLLLVVSSLAGGQVQALQSIHLNVEHSTDSHSSLPDHDSWHEHKHSHGEGRSHADANDDSNSEGSAPSDSNTQDHHSHGMAPMGTSIQGPAPTVAEYLAPRVSLLEAPLLNSITPPSRHLEPSYRPPKS